MFTYFIYAIVIGAILYVFVSTSDNMKIKKAMQSKWKETKAPQTKKIKKPDLNTDDFLNFEKIFSVGYGGDRNVGIVQRKDGVYVGAIEVKGINFNLLSQEEAIVLEDSFQKLLNGLDFSLQIFIQSKKIDVENYINIYKKRRNELLKKYENDEKRLRLSKDLSSQESQKIMISMDKLKHQIEYAEYLIDFIFKVCNDKQMLEKRYFIIIPYSRKGSAESLSLKQLEDLAVNDTRNKASGIISSLTGAGLSGRILNGVELAELIYISYNKADSETLKLSAALGNKFSHLITTSKPVELKLQELDSTGTFTN